jgi:hypothetical protein
MWQEHVARPSAHLPPAQPLEGLLPSVQLPQHDGEGVHVTGAADLQGGGATGPGSAISYQQQPEARSLHLSAGAHMLMVTVTAQRAQQQLPPAGTWRRHAPLRFKHHQHCTAEPVPSQADTAAEASSTHLARQHSPPICHPTTLIISVSAKVCAGQSAGAHLPVHQHLRRHVTQRALAAAAQRPLARHQGLAQPKVRHLGSERPAGLAAARLEQHVWSLEVAVDDGPAVEVHHGSRHVQC